MRRSQYRLTDSTGRVKYSFIATFNANHQCVDLQSLLDNEVPEHISYGAIEGSGGQVRTMPILDGSGENIHMLHCQETMLD